MKLSADETRERHRASAKRYYAKHKDKINAKATAKNQAYYAVHKEEIKTNVRAYAAANRLKIGAAKAAYARDNPEKVNANIRKNRKESPVKYLVRIAKYRSKRLSRDFSISADDLAMPTVCPLLGIPLDPFSEDRDLHPSIDRIDNDKGYVAGNVAIISHRANRIKSDATAAELRTMANNLDRLMGVCVADIK